MRVTVRYFGIIGDLAGRKDETVELADGATVGALIDALAAGNRGFRGIAKAVRAVVNGQGATRETPLADGDEVSLLRAIGGGEPRGRRLVHADLPIVASPSGLPSQHIVTEQVGAASTFLGQQWLQPGDRVRLHTHPVEEALMFLTGRGEATLGEETVAIGAGTSLYIPPGIVHGFRNTGDEVLHVVVVFPVPRFAKTTIVE